MATLSCTDLIKMGRYIPTPFHLSLAKSQKEGDLKVGKILRIVPGKRLVAVSSWQGRPVILKLFFGSGNWERNMLRDVDGINLMEQAGIATPKLMHQTTTIDEAGGALLIEYLSGGKELSTLFEQARNESKKNDVLNLAIENIARCHQAGFWQGDIHLDNFILFQGSVYLLDGGDIKSVEGVLDAEPRLDNLATFLAQLHARFDQNVEGLLQDYQRYSPELKGEDIDCFKSRIVKARNLRLSKYEKKLFRSTTAHCCEKGINQFLVYDRSIHSEELKRFIKNPDSFIDKEKLLKDGNSSTVAQVKIDGKKYVLKRYNIKGFWHFISRMFRPSRAHHSWRNALTLKMLGLGTPNPCLFLEKRIFGILRSKAYYLSEYVEGKNLGERIESQTIEQADFKNVTLAFRQLFHIMNDYRISHGDMKASNFIFTEKGLIVLDLDAMKRHSSKSGCANKLGKDLRRFGKNWQGTRFESDANTFLSEIAAELRE